MRVVALILRAAPEWLLVWLERRRAPLGERIAERAWREGPRRWRSGRPVDDRFIPF